MTTARWALVASLAAWVMWFFFWPASVVVGLIGVALGIVSARAAGRGGAARRTGVAAAVLGAFPLGVVVFYVVGAVFGWVEFR